MALITFSTKTSHNKTALCLSKPCYPISRWMATTRSLLVGHKKRPKMSANPFDGDKMWTNLIYLDTKYESSNILTKIWIYLSTSLFLVILIRNVNNCCQNCQRTRLAGSHLLSCLLLVSLTPAKAANSAQPST